MADWQDKVLNAPTPKATDKAFKGKKVKDVMKSPWAMPHKGKVKGK